MKIKVINKSNNPLPKYETEGSAGMDIRASFSVLDNNFKGESFSIHNTDKDGAYIQLESLGRILIPTDLYLEIPEGYEIQVRARSGLAINHGIMMTNGIGSIDSDYRGNIGMILTNTSRIPFIIKPGDRLGQIVLNKVERIEFEEVTKLSTTNRGSGGFGHTGK